MSASSDPGQSFRPKQKETLGLGWEKSRLSRYLYDIRAEGALPPSITNSEIKQCWAIGFAMFLLRDLIPKYKYMRSEFFLMKVIVALILIECFRNIKGNPLLGWVGGRAELFTCPYPLEVQARPPRDQRLATPSRISGRIHYSLNVPCYTRGPLLSSSCTLLSVCVTSTLKHSNRTDLLYPCVSAHRSFIICNPFLVRRFYLKKEEGIT